MIEVKAPGKLFIAGEYAVIETGYPAILVAIDQFISVKIEANSAKGSFTTTYPTKIMANWTRSKGRIVLENDMNHFKHLLSAIQIIEQIANDEGKELRYYHVHIESELAKENLKYGLGSSSALLVASIEAFCQLYGIKLNRLERFKAAVLAQLLLTPLSSCGDLAASTYGGWIAYHKFDAKWVLQELERTSIRSLIEMKWPSLSIERLVPPNDLTLLIGWTKSPASTTHYVKTVYQKRTEHEREYDAFLKDSKKCVEELIHAFKDSNLAGIKAGLQKNRKILIDMSQSLKIELETLQLTLLCQLAEVCHFSAKSSGAGGGDCGIAIGNSNLDTMQLLKLWQEYKIERLPFKVYEEGGLDVK